MCDNICRCRNKMDERTAVRCWGEEKWPTPLCRQLGVDPTGRMMTEVKHAISPTTPNPHLPASPTQLLKKKLVYNKYKFCNTVLDSNTFKFFINFWNQILVFIFLLVVYVWKSGSEYFHRGRIRDLYLKDKINMHNNPD